MFKYQVTFEPDIQSKLLKQELMKQHDYLFDNCKAFDGENLYALNKLDNNVIKLYFYKAHYTSHNYLNI